VCGVSFLGDGIYLSRFEVRGCIWILSLSYYVADVSCWY
jgi:hypothetical protein